jgi:hypothetical protein
LVPIINMYLGTITTIANRRHALVNRDEQRCRGKMKTGKVFICETVNLSGDK